MPKYSLLTDGGDSYGDVQMYIRVYPNTSNEEGDVDSQFDTVPESLKNACEQLLTYGSIDYYRIYKFNVADSDHYPNTDNNNLFQSWLEDGSDNGYGEDLSAYSGTHLLVGDYKECSTSTANAAYVVGCGDNAFTTGVGAISPLSGCSTAKIKASAVQETLHNFINWESQDVRCLVDCGFTYDDYQYEHALGERNSNHKTTPLLTYHPSLNGIGDCSYNGADYGYTTSLTWCTKEAVKITGNYPYC